MILEKNKWGEQPKCEECSEELNEDDERWNGVGTVFCRECVHEPVFNARDKFNRDVARAKAWYTQAKNEAVKMMSQKREGLDYDVYHSRGLDINE